MTTICLVRHGETDWNVLGKIQGRTDIPLNKIGILQAEDCREHFKGSSWDVVITSPLKRAKQTALIINEGLNAPMIEMKEFVERSFGDAEGMTWPEIVAAYPDKNYPNQEDHLTLTKRVMGGLEKIHKEHTNGKVLLVAHGAVINAILAFLSNGEIGTGKTKIMNACISNLQFHEEKWLIKDYNQVTHLSSNKVF